MKFYWGYAPTPTSAKIISDREIFLWHMKAMGKVGCEFLHFFDDNEITSYQTVVIAWFGDAFYARVREVEDIFGMSPIEVRYVENQMHAIYSLSRKVNQATWKMCSQTMAELLWGSYQEYTFFSLLSGSKYENPSSVVIIEKIMELHSYLFNDNAEVHDAVNQILIPTANSVAISDVIQASWVPAAYDEVTNIAIWYGKPFQMMMSLLKSVDWVLKFFNEHFKIGFTLKTAGMESYMVHGVTGMMPGIIEYNGGYGVESKQNGIIQITDFTIKVHYKYISDKDVSYVISLINKSGKKAEHITWKNSVSETTVTEMIQKLGNFHFLTPKKEYIIKIHSMISSVEVPTITAIRHYGRSKFKWNDILILKNGVYDISRKRWFPKEDDSEFYFMEWTDGFVLRTHEGSPVSSIIWWMVSSNVSTAVNTADKFIEIFQPLYKDITGDMLVLTACCYLGYALYGEDQNCPLFAAYGGTWSGKTTYSSFLQKLLGIYEKPMTFESGTTTYAMLRKMTHISHLPLMCSEFRSWADGMVEKLAIFRSLYDRSNISKGRIDQTLVQYNLVSTFFMEWEELPEDGAVRSRFVHKMLARRFRVDGINVEKLVELKKNIIDSFVNSYFTLSTREKYFEAINEWEELFRDNKIEPRIIHNAIMMYAGFITFAPDKKDYAIDILKKVIAQQQHDFEDNGTAQQILKVVSRYLSTRFSKIYIVRQDVIFAWNDIVDYIEKNRIKMTLGLDAYRDHLIWLWFQEWLYDVEYDGDFWMKEWMLIDGFKIHISKCPRELQVKKEVYSLAKNYEKDFGKNK